MNEPVVAEKPAVDRLDAMFFQLVELFDRFTQERQLLNKEKEEFAKLTQLLVSQTKEVSKFELTIRKNIQDSIQTSADLSIGKMNESFSQKGHASIEQVVNKIKQHHEIIETAIEKFHKEKNRSFWKIIGVVLLSSLLSSLTIAFLMPKSTLSLSSEQLNYLRDGQMLAKIWPRLSDTEKNHLKNIVGQIVQN